MVWENTTVICDETVFNYNAPVEQMSARVSVLVNNEEDMLDTQVITVYKCSVLGSYRGAQDCTLCSLKSRSHGCGWCPKIGCVSASRCPTRCVLTNFSESISVSGSEECAGWSYEASDNFTIFFSIFFSLFSLLGLSSSGMVNSVLDRKSFWSVLPTGHPRAAPSLLLKAAIWGFPWRICEVASKLVGKTAKSWP